MEESEVINLDKVKPKSKRSSLSHSPLAKPKKLIYATAARVQDWIYFPDPSPLYLVLGTVAANMIHGDKTWIMLVGASGAGKTMVLDMLRDVPKIHVVSAIKGHAAFLSGTGAKDKSKDATGGLLREVGDRGLIVVKDFAEILSSGHEPLVETIGAFRGIYDGDWSRRIGGEGGRKLTWRGRLGFLGASTPKIDDHHKVISELGQRWLYYRYPMTDGFGESKSSLKQKDKTRAAQELCDLVSGFFDTMDLGWDETDKPELNDEEYDRLIAMASLMVGVRSPVSRDRLMNMEVTNIATPEAPQRMATALGQLYCGLKVVEVSTEERWGIIGKVALDSAPEIRSMALIALKEAGGTWIELKNLVEVLQCGPKTVRFMLEDLQLFGIVHIKQSKARISNKALKWMEFGWKGIELPPVRVAGRTQDTDDN